MGELELMRVAMDISRALAVCDGDHIYLIQEALAMGARPVEIIEEIYWLGRDDGAAAYREWLANADRSG